MTNYDYHEVQSKEDVINGTVQLKYINSSYSGESERDRLIVEAHQLRDMINQCVHSVNVGEDYDLTKVEHYTSRYSSLVDAYNLTMLRLNYLNNQPKLLGFGSNIANMISKAKKTAELTIGKNATDPVKSINEAIDQVNTTKAEVSLAPETGTPESLENTLTEEDARLEAAVTVIVEHLNVTYDDDNTEACVFHETEVLTVFTKTGIVCKGVVYLEPGDILVGRKYVSKVKQIHK